MDLSLLVMIRSQSESTLQNTQGRNTLWSPIPIRKPCINQFNLGISDFRDLSPNSTTDVPQKSKSANIFGETSNFIEELFGNSNSEEDAGSVAPVRASNPHIQDNKFIEVNDFYDRMRRPSDSASTDSHDDRVELFQRPSNNIIISSQNFDRSPSSAAVMECQQAPGDFFKQNPCRYWETFRVLNGLKTTSPFQYTAPVPQNPCVCFSFFFFLCCESCFKQKQKEIKKFDHYVYLYLYHSCDSCTSYLRLLFCFCVCPPPSLNDYVCVCLCVDLCVSECIECESSKYVCLVSFLLTHLHMNLSQYIYIHPHTFQSPLCLIQLSCVAYAFVLCYRALWETILSAFHTIIRRWAWER
eukprot:TRINITY_DN5208_c0_g2_i8.p1 TRINITY_DN5208_c0_g2~~TRINITY_DN5208_c0_g2_i8.p1  ORF type:complete len:355 (-),score=3.28 TRINITY_DN5208_c0_g2_i8:208-1272(-)